MTTIIISSILFIAVLFAIKFFQDLCTHKAEIFVNGKKNILLIILSPLIFFFATLGASDFALSTILYRKFKIIKDSILPGTLNTQCIIPLAIMSITFISGVKVDTLTLVTCLSAQVIGAYIGPRFVVKLSERIIRLWIGSGLIIACILILISKFGFLPVGGTLIGLTGIKLVIAAVSMFVFGALNNIGIGSFAPTMITIYALGMSPITAFPIMMGACALSTSVGALQFIKYNKYDRTITLFVSIFGIIGVLLGIKFLKVLDFSQIQWVIAFILLYTGANMLLTELKSQKKLATEAI